MVPLKGHTACSWSQTMAIKVQPFNSYLSVPGTHLVGQLTVAVVSSPLGRRLHMGLKKKNKKKNM